MNKKYLLFILIVSFVFFCVQLNSLANQTIRSKVFIVKTADRAVGINELVKKFKLPDLTGKKVVIKPNFNSNDPFPATTHIETLKTVIEILKTAHPASITIIERSGMGNTDAVLKDRGVYALASDEKINIINLDKLDKKEWERRGTEGTHWRKGYLIPKILLDADYVVNLPCLKTHRFGGDFTMSLKNNVGSIAKMEGIYNYMWELHLSRNQRLMIAEINKDIRCDLIVLDAIQGFSTEGPNKGNLIEPGLILLSNDRIALDAVGVSILRMYGTTKKVSDGKIFDQDQIKRAVELGIGVRSARDIELVPINQDTKAIADKIGKIL